jgi:hypothetical protein
VAAGASYRKTAEDAAGEGCRALGERAHDLLRKIGKAPTRSLREQQHEVRCWLEAVLVDHSCR